MSTDTMDPPDVAENDTANAAHDPPADEPNGEAQPATEPPQSPDELRRSHYDEIVSLSRRVAEAKQAWHDLKGQSSEAKKEYEGLDAALLRLTRRDPMQRTLLRPDDQAGQSDEPLPADDSWKRLDVNLLDLTPTVLNSLYTAGIMTLGDLQDYWHGGKQLSDLKGIGEASDASIRDAFSDYGLEHPEVFGEQQTAGGAAESEEDEEDDELPDGT